MNTETRAILIADLSDALPAEITTGTHAMFVNNYFTAIGVARVGEELGWIRYQGGAFHVTGDGIRAVLAYRAA